MPAPSFSQLVSLPTHGADRELMSCDECGAVVDRDNAELHTQWHENIRQRIRIGF